MTVGHALARGFWRVSRWTLKTERVPTEGAGLLIGAPHTSNWDFILMLAIAGEAELPIRWLGKNGLFRGIGGPGLRGGGGGPGGPGKPPGGAGGARAPRPRGGRAS